MGVRVIAKDVDAEAFATEYAAPVRRGLEGIHFLNTTPQKAAHNYAPGKKSGFVVGSPVAKADSLATVGLTSFIQTDVPEVENMTIFCIGRHADTGAANATRPAFFGTFNGLAADKGAADGATLYSSSTTSMAVNGGFGNSATDKVNIIASISAADITKWALFVYEVNSRGVFVRDVTNLRNASNTAVNGLPRRPTTNKFRVGSAFANLAGFCDVAVWQAHSVSLTEEEIATTIADLRSYALRKGITV